MDAIKLTKRVVDAAVAGTQRYTLFDSAISGFGLRVYPSGQKSWVFEYRPGEGGRRVSKKRITIGKVSDFTPDGARKVADGLRSAVKTGKDPQGERARQREAPTLSDIAHTFLKDHVGAKRKPSTKAHYEDVINRLVLPTLGKLKAKDITRAEVARLHLRNAATPFQANRILAIVGSMYAFAGKHGLVPQGINPTRGIERFKEDSRERFLSSDELERLGASIRLAETTGIPWVIDDTKNSKHLPKSKRETAIGEHAAAAIRLLILTGARLREILHLKWEHVDLERGLLLLPDSKTGKKTIVLNAPAVSILSDLPKAGAYVIASDSAGTENEKPRADLKRPWAVVVRHAKLDGVRLHDLRHNFAAFGAGGGMGLPIIGKLLGHTQPQTTARYAHLDADPLRRASDKIGSGIAAAMGEPVRQTAKGLPIRDKI
jgi:integrase